MPTAAHTYVRATGRKILADVLGVDSQLAAANPIACQVKSLSSLLMG